MPTSNARFGPLTFGTLLGAAIGLVIAGYGMYAILNGFVDRSHKAVIFVALGSTVVGGGVGVFVEILKQHPAIAHQPWVQHLLRPIALSTVPYLLIANALNYFGNDALMGGFSFLLFGFLFPCWGFAILMRRRRDPDFNRRFTRPEVSDSKSGDN